MKYRSRILVFAVAVSIIGLGISYPSLILFIKYPRVDIVGTVDYTALPESEIMLIHGPKYFFIPDEKEGEKLKGVTPERLTLVSNRLSPELEGKKVRVLGTFVPHYQDYLSEILRPPWAASIGDPGGPVIVVRDIHVLD